MSDDVVKRRPGRQRKDAAEATDPDRAAGRRVPFGGFTYKLEVTNKDPAYWYYWFSDRGDTIERALRAGYEFVNRREANRLMPEELTNRDVHGGNQSLTDDVRVFGGRDEYGRDFNLVLMRQPMEYHLEDMAAEEARNDEIDRSITRQSFQNHNIANKYGDVTMTTKDQE